MSTPYYRAVRHLSRHVAWPNVIIIWMVLGLLAWGSPHWWAAALFALIVPPVVAIQGHLLGCSIPADMAARQSDDPAPEVTP